MSAVYCKREFRFTDKSTFRAHKPFKNTTYHRNHSKIKKNSWNLKLNTKKRIMANITAAKLVHHMETRQNKMKSCRNLTFLHVFHEVNMFQEGTGQWRHHGVCTLWLPNLSLAHRSKSRPYHKEFTLTDMFTVAVDSHNTTH